MNNKKILVPVDFSAASINALVFAVEFAERSKRNILLFHSKSGDEKGDQSKLASIAADLKLNTRSIEVETMISEYYFDTVVLNKAVASQSIGLVIMGTDGTGENFTKKLFGTNAAGAAEDLDCPVMVIPSSVSFSKMNKMAFASDLLNLEKELPLVFEFGRIFNAQILVFHVSPGGSSHEDSENRNIRKEVSRIAALHQYSDVDFYFEETSRGNQVQKGIKQFIEKHQTDLLIIFHERREGFQRLFSSTETEKVVKEFEIPSLIMRKP